MRGSDLRRTTPPCQLHLFAFTYHKCPNCTVQGRRSVQQHAGSSCASTALSCDVLIILLGSVNTTHCGATYQQRTRTGAYASILPRLWAVTVPSIRVRSIVGFSNIHHTSAWRARKTIIWQQNTYYNTYLLILTVWGRQASNHHANSHRPPRCTIYYGSPYNSHTVARCPPVSLPR